MIDSTSSPLRRLALVSPSVTYGPNRPSLITIGLPVAGSVPSSRSGGAEAPCPATTFGLGVDLQRLVERDVEHLLLGRQRARVGAALEIWPVAAVLRGDLLAGVRVDADHAGQRQQPQRILERHRLQVHRPQQRAGARLGAGRLLALLGRSTVVGLRRARAAPRSRTARSGRPWRRSRDRSPGRRRATRPSCGVAKSFSASSSVSSSGVSSSLEVGPLRCGLTVVADDHPLQVRAVPADPHVDRAALLVVEQLDGVDLSGIDAFEVDADELLQPAGAGDRLGHAVVAAEVEVAQPVVRCSWPEAISSSSSSIAAVKS